jgi:hypothetical protein
MRHVNTRDSQGRYGERGYGEMVAMLERAGER